jgi:hypothetical protein
MDFDAVAPRRGEMPQPFSVPREFHPDETMRIIVYPSGRAIRIHLHRDRVIAGRCETETLSAHPTINVDRIGGLVVGIEILT